MTDETTRIPFALLFGDPTESGGATRVVEAAADVPATAESVCAKLAEVGVTPADARTRVELVIPTGPSSRDVLVLYTALAGFFGRFVPARIGGEQIEPPAAEVEPGDKPGSVPEQVTVADLESIRPNTVHYARRAVLDVADGDAGKAAQLLVLVSHLRARPHGPRLPHLGEESLEEVRRAAVAARTDLRRSATATTVEKAGSSSRLSRLNHVASTPIADVLRRLGTTHDAEGVNWHCPRPDRHSNGDQNPSMRIVDGKIRCFRCDPEWIDSLRVVMDTLDVSPDEAAAWIESGESQPALR